MTANTALIGTTQAETNTFFLLWAGANVFLMQAGFATLSAGSIRQKNVKNILCAQSPVQPIPPVARTRACPPDAPPAHHAPMRVYRLKNLLDACMGAVTWYFIGFGFAYDNDAGANSFIGRGPSNFALSGLNDMGATHANGNDWIGWYFQFAFAAAAATIVSGAVAERCALSAYLIYTCCITGFIYPVVVHWVWDSAGWLSAFNPNAILSGCIDFAGSGVVRAPPAPPGADR